MTTLAAATLSVPKPPSCSAAIDPRLRPGALGRPGRPQARTATSRCCGSTARVRPAQPGPAAAAVHRGLRVSEIAELKWRDLQPRTDGGQVTVFGKGSKTHTVLLPNAIWRDLLLYRQHAGMDAPVFASRRRRWTPTPDSIERLVLKAAQRAGVEGKVSPHWLRHSHATHALERAPIHLVQARLGHASVATTGRYLHARPTDSSSVTSPRGRRRWHVMNAGRSRQLTGR
jgi:hypothetical protein